MNLYNLKLIWLSGFSAVLHLTNKSAPKLIPEHILGCIISHKIVMILTLACHWKDAITLLHLLHFLMKCFWGTSIDAITYYCILYASSMSAIRALIICAVVALQKEAWSCNSVIASFQWHANVKIITIWYAIVHHKMCSGIHFVALHFFLG